MPIDRRTFIRDSALAGAAVAAGSAAAAPAAQAAEPSAQRGGATGTFTILGTTDLHSHAFDWDYDLDAPYSDPAGDAVGIAKVATLVEQQRAARGAQSTLLVDAGDIIQGTSLAYYFARVSPITGPGKPVHPMAAAMNAMQYDCAALGNHEFNYGIPLLREFQRQLRFPLLGANALDARTKRPAFPPFTVKTVQSAPGLPPVKVGILGLTNPGIALWDHDNVAGKMEFGGLVELAQQYVPMLRRLCDVVFLTDHSGLDGSSSYGDALPYPENASNLVAEQVPGIDAILVGHTHVEVAHKEIANKQTGKAVVLSEPFCFGKRVSVFEFAMRREGHRWAVDGITASVLNSNTAEEHPRITALLAADQKAVRAYGATRLGSCTAAMSGAESCWKDTAIVDFINAVQTDRVKANLSGDDAKLPVVSTAAPFSRTAAVPKGDVLIRDLDGLYPYDNTLYGKKLTGAQIRDYLEFAAEYYYQFPAGTKVDTAKLTNKDQRWDYTYDIMSGVGYEIDIAKDPGKRVANLTFDGKPVADDQMFVVAVNNYRASGGSDYPHIVDAPVVYSTQDEIRQMMIDTVKASGTLDPSSFSVQNWRLTQDGTAVFPD